MNKYINKLLLIAALAVTGMIGITSCTDYLEKSPKSDIAENDPYKNYKNFQGFIEELYNCVPVVSNNDYHTSFNLGEEVYWEPQELRVLARSIDYGDFWGFTTCYYAYPSTIRGGNANSQDKAQKGNLWKLCWYGIRKANIGIASLDKLVSATEEESNLIEGQLYFFRAWFHFMLMEWWGGMPYIDEALPTDANPTLPRETWQACAEKCVTDFDRAIKLLPVDWDQTTTGKATLGLNDMRINKIMAMAYKGKTLLWAGSPLMNWASGGAREYNKDLCKRSADVFGETLKLIEETNRYELAPIESYNDIFLVYNSGGKLNGMREAIFRENLVGYNGRWAWNMNTDFRSQRMVSSGIKCWPTANYANYFGMANGYPIDDMTKADAESGYNPAYPWKGRDPRFYKNYIIDGEFCGDGGDGMYSELYTGGKDREGANPQKGCYTGYMNAKMSLKITNNTNARGSHFFVLSLMRLADVYLMYSEAAAVGYGSPTGKTANYDKTAVDALNKIRERAAVEPVLDKFLGSTESFLSELRRERAVELSFEGFRFMDLRRWMLLTQRPYTLKTGIQFDRGVSAAAFNKEKPEENPVLNLREEVLIERKYTDRHYWFPLPNKNDVYMYEGFDQNPGW